MKLMFSLASLAVPARESMQHRFPDMGEVVIDQQNVGQLAARQPPAQVGCCDNPSDPATYHNDTVHISCPSTPFLPRMGEVKQEPSSLTCSRFNVRRRITENLGRQVRNVAQIFPSRNTLGYFVTIRRGGALGVCPAGEITNVTQAFQPSGRLSWANSQ